MPTPPSLSHPAMRRPLREATDGKPAHPLASSFVAPSRSSLADEMQGPADAPEGHNLMGREDAPTHDAAAATDARLDSHQDHSMEDGQQADERVAEQEPHEAAHAEAQGSQQQAEDEGDAAQPPSVNGEIAPLPVSDASALNLFLDAADYLDWELPGDSSRPNAAGHGNDANGGSRASLTDSMSAMLEAQRLLANRMESEQASGGGDAVNNGEKSGWQEHVALLMGLGQSSGPNAEASAQEGLGQSAEQQAADPAHEHEERPPSAKRGRGGRRGGRGRGGRTAGGDVSLHEDEAGPSQRTGGKEVLSDQQKKANHIRSEHRRRNAIKIGYAELGCLEHMSVNIPWPSGEELVDEAGQVRDDPGVHIEGRLIPAQSVTKAKKRRADGNIDGEDGPPYEEPVFKKPAANKVAKGWSKNAVLQKGAALSRWLREGNEWLSAEIERLEKLLMDADREREQEPELYHDPEGGSAAVIDHEDGHETLQDLDPALTGEAVRRNSMSQE